MANINTRSRPGTIARRQKKIKEVVNHAIIHIHSTFNNTIVTLTRTNGETIAQESAGTIGYKGTKKSTPYAAQVAASKVLEIARKYGVKELDVKINGIGSGRSSILRTLEGSEFQILSIADVTAIAHNGCRPPKRPRG